MSINRNEPSPVKQFIVSKTKVFIYKSAKDAGYAAAINVALNQMDLFDKKGFVSIVLMAAPSAYEFYKSYIKISKTNKNMQNAIKNTHYFQMDDYPLPEDHPASFRYLLKTKFFNHLEKYIDKNKIHLLKADSKNISRICVEYKNLILDYGQDIQIKGQGEDGHWGFYQPYNSFDGEPSIIKVKLNKMNVSQQLRDHPNLYNSLDDPTKVAFTGNVPLFMRTKVLIEDIVPQRSKAFTLVASYGNEEIDPICPSGKIKEHPNSYARINMDSAWALIEYREKGYLSEDAIFNLDKIWETPGDRDATVYKKRFMRKAFKRLNIKYKDYKK